MKIRSLIKKILPVAVMCLLRIPLYSQQPPKTAEELEAFIKSVQKKSDSIKNAMNKTVGKRGRSKLDLKQV